MSIKEKKTKSNLLQYRITFCPFCGKLVDHQKQEEETTSNCLICGRDLNQPFRHAREDFEQILICKKCEQLNPPIISFCWKCGSDEFTQDAVRAKKLMRRSRFSIYLNNRRFLYFVSLILAIGISLGLLLGVARQYVLINSLWVFSVLFISMTVVISFMIYIPVAYWFTRNN